MSNRFFFDSNSFITPFHLYYAPDIVPTFWSALQPHLQQEIVLLDLVRDELLEGNDWLVNTIKEWQDSQLLQIISHKDTEIIMYYGKILDYLQSCGKYKEEAISTWSNGKVADAWLIASAIKYKATIVTFERSSGPIVNLSKNAKIPDIAAHFNVPCITLFDFMRQQHITI